MAGTFEELFIVPVLKDLKINLKFLYWIQPNFREISPEHILGGIRAKEHFY